MKKFRVTIYYKMVYETMVDAETSTKACDIAEDKAQAEIQYPDNYTTIQIYPDEYFAYEES